jgi:hypothetical protein
VRDQIELTIDAITEMGRAMPDLAAKHVQTPLLKLIRASRTAKHAIAALAEFQSRLAKRRQRSETSALDHGLFTMADSEAELLIGKLRLAQDIT